jgi:hypothetical protein
MGVRSRRTSAILPGMRSAHAASALAPLLLALATACPPTTDDPASKPTATAGPPIQGVTATTSYARQNTPAPTDVGVLLQANGLSGHYFDARQYVDLDGDGVREIVVAPGRDVSTATAVHVFKSQAGGWVDATAAFFGAAVPAQIHARKVLAADFNGDGVLDLYFVDHGYDHPPFPGAQNVLALSGTGGRWTQKEIAGNPTAFQHCAAAGDIDNNGTVDVFACADGYQGTEKGPYFLLNDGAGEMTLTRDGVPESLRDGLLAAELVDVDGDGYLDLVASSRHAGTSFGTTVYWHWGAGAGSYSDSRATTLPNPPTFVATYDAKAEDIDGDGRRDLVLLRVRGDLSGYYLQILRQTGARTFEDESIPRIIHDASTWEGLTGAWFPWIHLAELGGVASLDLAIGDSSANVPARAGMRWSNDGRGFFTKTP